MSIFDIYGSKDISNEICTTITNHDIIQKTMVKDFNQGTQK